MSPFEGTSQTVISGKLIGEEQQPVANVSVSYRRVGSPAILGFSKSKEDGTYRIEVKVKDVDSVQVEFSHMSYAKRTVVVLNHTAQYSYQLENQAQEIKEVRVDNMPIFRRKDTINYQVNAFTSKQDRVIADIIRKLPGITMVADEIFYQGRPIQKYMVNNLDLMGGRYGMINNNLPADAVKNVQVVENDQPIKILDSLVFSNEASLNLELKKFTSTGSGKIGAGFSPILWDVNLTPMTFGKTFQMLNSFQTNNTGHDAAKDLRSFYTGSGSSSSPPLGDGPSYISLRDVSSPGFAENKWLDNKLFLFSSNVLQKLNNGLELKGNLSYYDDARNRSGFTATQYFTADDVIYNTEGIENRFRINVLDAGVLVKKNEKEIYLRNSLKYHKRWNSDRGDLLFNEDNPILQRSNYTDEVLQNSLSFIRRIGRQHVSVQSNLEWRQTPQSLVVRPGQFEDILSEGLPLDEMGQQVLYKAFRWNNSLHFTKRYGNWRFFPSVAVNYARTNLDTKIGIRTGEDTRVLGEGYFNDVDNSQLNLSAGLGIGWETNRWKLMLTSPYNLNYYNVSQQGVKTLDNTIRNTFNPSLSATYMINSNNEISSSISTGRSFGGLDKFYNSYIIGMYRSMQRYDARLLRNDNRSARISYKYKNPLKANFADFSYRYSQDERDYIFDSRIDSLGRTNLSIGDRISASDSHSLDGNISRFFSALKTVAKLSGSLRWNRSDYLLNGHLAKQRTQYREGSLELINTSSKIVSGEFKTIIGQTKSILASDRKTNVLFNNHFLNLMFYPIDGHAVTMSNSLYGNNYPGQENQFFIDAKYTYTVKKWKMDFELMANNLLNNDHYLQQFTTDIQLIQTYFELRPRQFILSTKFRF